MKKPIRPFSTALLGACTAALLLAAVPAGAQEAVPAPLPDAASVPGDRLLGTLAQVASRGTLRLGWRASSPPFSSTSADGRTPEGYTIDLCREIAADAAAAVQRADLRIEYVPVTPEDRFDKLVNGEIDLECGSTTASLDRARHVAFSPMTFVTATRLLVKRDSGVRRLADLRGRPVAVTRGTTNAVAVRALAQRRGLAVRFVEVADHSEAMQLFTLGQVDAVASDDVLLRTWLATQPQRARFRITDEALSHEPYAIAYRRDDPQFAVVVEHAFRRLAADRELARLYDRWFMRRLPSGEQLRLPMPPELETAFEALGQPGP